LVELSKAQDIEAGDGTTSVVVLAGALLGAASNLLAKGMHPTTISNAFQLACQHAQVHLRTVAQPVQLSNRDELLQSAVTSLNSKIVSQYSSLIAPLAVDAVLRVIDPETAVNVDLNSDVRVVKHTGGTIDDTELVDGLVFTQRLRKSAGGPGTVKNAKIALIQFQLSPPKPNVGCVVCTCVYLLCVRVGISPRLSEYRWFSFRSTFC
jgi:T-complex protein 1 subunit delta